MAKFDDIFVKAVPKSASTTFADYLKYLNHNGYMGCNSINKDHGNSYVKGANNGYIILTRHPKDQLVAEYCDVAYICMTSDKNPPSKIQSHFYVLETDNILESPKRGIIELMNKGHLESVLTWMFSWLDKMDKQKCMFIRYEDMIANPMNINFNRYINQIMRFTDATRKNLSIDDTNYGIRMLNKYKSNRVDTMNDAYPLGYSGTVGISNKYFDDELNEKYVEIVDGYIKSNPLSHMLNLLYPNLYDI